MVIRHESGKSVVYVLSAGASKAVIPDAPLMAQLLPDALDVLGRPKYSGGVWRERVDRMKQFIDNFYQLNPGTLQNLEDILTQLDDAIGEGRPLSREYNVSFLRTLREDLVFAICEVLRIKLGFGEESGRQLMQRFMQRLGPSDSILSQNYDIIVDNALSMRSGSGLLVDYGLSARYALDNPCWRSAYNLSERPQQNLTPPLYKLHGSLNWLYCPSCQQLDVTIGQKGVHYIYEEGSDYGGTKSQDHFAIK